MIKLLHILIFISVLIYSRSSAQPTPFDGTLLFNLNDQENDPYRSLTPEGLKIKNIRFLARHPRSTLKYDTINKAFSITLYGNESKDFALVYNRDTIYIKYPSKSQHQRVFIKTRIPLNGKSYSFYNNFTYDAMHSNAAGTTIFNLCQGCMISQYEMTDESKRQIQKINRKRKWIVVALEN